MEEVFESGDDSCPEFISGSDSDERLELSESKIEEEVFGVTVDNTRFVVPETWDVIEGYVKPGKWLEFPVYFQLIYAVLVIAAAFFGWLPQSIFIAAYVFWRLCYNVGLGYILRGQSNYESFTEMYREKIKFSPFWYSFFERNISLKKVENGEKKILPFEMKKYNDYFNSWMIYRFVVDIVLGCDVFSYFALCISFFTVPDKFDFFQIAMYVAGLILILFNIYVKSEAHHVIGDYAWYWGDFYFRLERSLIFDSVFQMAPHPMYTIGYAFYYGASLLTHSYTVFYISFLGHMLQIVFLVFIEEPHIEKIYGAVVNLKKEKLSSLKEYFPTKELFLFNHLNIFNSSDLNLTIITGYTILLYFCNLSQTFYFGHVIFWRMFHTFFLGGILYFQSGSNFWVDRFPSKKVAFSHWKKLYNTSLTVNYIVFITCAMKYAHVPENWSIPKIILNAFISVCLMSITVWSSFSIHDTIGDFGWFYGDFFLDGEIKREKNSLYYSGLYRYINNPDLVLGCTIYYGLALFSHSVDVFILALFTHFCTYLFIQYVEEPHMRKIYGREKVRKAGGLTTEGVKETKKIVKKVKNFLNIVKSNSLGKSKEI